MAALRKSVLITGCSAGGIGDGLADMFREKGYHVFATVRNLAKISQTLSKAPNVTVLKLDVLSSESIAAAVESVTKETGGKLDVLVNNSGSNIIAPALDVPLEEHKKLFDLNFWAPLAMVQAFAPLVIKAQGTVVNNTSANAIIPMALMSMYNGSKGALYMASETLRLELAPLGVRVITLVTFGVKTHFFAEDQTMKIPETSYYSGIRDFIHDLGDGRLQKGAISPRQYATTVVGAVDKGFSGPLWVGTSATMARVGWWMSPQFVKDKLVESIVPFAGEMAKAKKQT